MRSHLRYQLSLFFQWNFVELVREIYRSAPRQADFIDASHRLQAESTKDEWIIRLNYSRRDFRDPDRSTAEARSGDAGNVVFYNFILSRWNPWT